MKLEVRRDYELTEDGVTSVWSWVCPDPQCAPTTRKGSALYWENALKGARAHLRSFHAKV